LQITEVRLYVEDPLGKAAEAFVEAGLMVTKAAAEYPKSNPRTEQKD